MTDTSIILLVVIVLAVIALLWMVFGRSKPDAGPAEIADPVVEAPSLDRVAPSVPQSPPPPQPAPAAMQGVLPGTLPEMERPTHSPAAKAAPPPELINDIVPQPEERDNLAMMKGVGPKIVSLLHAEGITRFAQIAAWTDADVDAIDARMGNFRGRIRRDNWVDQARFLAVGDRAGYEVKYGKL